MTISQLRQPTATDLPTSNVTEQKTTSITQPSATTDLPILDETSAHVDQVLRPDAPQSVHYKAPADIQPATGSLFTTASALSGEEPAQETSVNVTQLRQPTATDLPISDVTEQKTTSVIQPSATTDLPILDDTWIYVDQVLHPDTPQSVHYKAPAHIQPSTGSILTTASALTDEEPAQETPVTITQLRHPAAKDLPTSDVTEQQATSVTQLSATTDLPILDETLVHVDQVLRPDAPQSVHYKAPADIQATTGSLLTTTSALGGEEPAQETPMNVNQLRHPTATDIPTSDATQQQAVSVTQPSTSMDLPILDETSVHVDQVLRPDAPQSVHYKAPADIQPSTGSILTTASALSGEEPAQETSVNVTQLRHPTATDLPTTDVIEQQATSVTQPSASSDLPILDETSVHVDQVLRPDAPQSIHYKAPADIQPSTGSLLTTTSALSGEEPAQETPVNVSQLRQPTATDLPTSDVVEQKITSVTQPSATTDLPILDETSVHVDQVLRPDAPQSVHYKAPADIQPSAGSLLTTTSALRW